MNSLHSNRLASLLLLSPLLFSALLPSSVEAAKSTPKTLSVALDNDILVPGSRDQDYTAGFNIAYNSSDANQSTLYLDSLLSSFDRLVSIDKSSSNHYSVEGGLYGFTPEFSESPQPNHDDRPFASLLYLSSSHQRVAADEQSAWQSRLTLGVLGLDSFADLQDSVHTMTGSKEVHGWDNQISDGGEITARYQLAKQTALKLQYPNLESKITQQISIGYITEASVSISSRYGNINSNWWGFNPEMPSYGEQRSGPVGLDESFFFAGASLKARAYNAFLQGQFRHSEVSYSHDQINHVLVEMWAGYSQSFGQNYQMSYLLRGQSSEIKQGDGDRNLVWGGVVVSKSWL